jgi:hypothetical protein
MCGLSERREKMLNVYYMVGDRGYVGWKKVCEIDEEYEDVSMFDYEDVEESIKFVGFSDIGNFVVSEKEIDWNVYGKKGWEGNMVEELK